MTLSLSSAKREVMALGGQHVSGFSPDGKLYALVNEQGILKIWDTEINELKQEYIPNLHLSSPCSALTWMSASQEKKSKNELKSTSYVRSMYIALGTYAGRVSLYSYSLGKVERTLKGEGHSGTVASIFFDNESKLYTCGSDCQIIIWCLASGCQISAWSVGNEKPYSIVYLENSNNVVVGARQIKVFSAESQELVQTFTGHTSEITTLTTFCTGNTEYVVTASKMERIICVWKIGKKGRNKSASCTLLMEDIAYCLTCQLDDEGNLKVASVTRSGVIHVYLISLESLKVDKPIKPKVTIEIASDSANVIEPIPAVTASLQHAWNNEILFGYGDVHFMVFEHIAPSYTEKLQVLVRTDPKKRLAKGINEEPLYGSALKTLTPFVNENEVNYKTGATILRKKLKAIEMPFESRLKNLNLNVGERPQAQSKVQLLIQALHSKDLDMLMMVLITKDPKVIQMTLQKLPVQYVACLVNELTLLMQNKRSNVEISANWLKVLTQTHASQLMALGADDLLEKFGPCIGIIEHRANCLMEVSKLNGRLQLLVSQIKRNTEEDNLNNENVLLYEDNDSSNSDLEDEIEEKSVSDGEWSDEDSTEEMES